MVGGGEGKVGKSSVVRQIELDSGCVFEFLSTKIIEELGGALVAVFIGAEGVDDSDLAKVYGGSNGGCLAVTRNESDILNTATNGNGDGADDRVLINVPDSKMMWFVAGAVDIGNINAVPKVSSSCYR